MHVRVMTRTRPAQPFFAVTAQSCYSENELSWSGPSNDRNTKHYPDSFIQVLMSTVHLDDKWVICFCK